MKKSLTKMLLKKNLAANYILLPVICKDKQQLTFVTKKENLICM